MNEAARPAFPALLALVSGLAASSAAAGMPSSVPGATPQLPHLGSLGGLHGRAVAISGDYAYAGQGSALAVYDIRDPENPTTVGRLALAGPPRSISVHSDYAAIATGAGGLALVNLVDPRHPTLASNTMVGHGAFDVARRGDRVYVAAGEAGLLVFDVSSPRSPVRVGGLALDGVATAVHVEAGLCVVAASLPHVGWVGTLHLVDVTDQEGPVYLGHAYQASMYGHIEGQPSSVDRAGDLVAVGFAAPRCDGHCPPGGGVQLIDVSDPRRAFPLGTWRSGVVTDVVLRDDLAYATAGDVHRLDLSNREAPQAIDTLRLRDVHAVAVDQSRLVAVGARLDVFRVDSTGHPRRAGAVVPEGAWTARHLALDGKLAFATDEQGNLRSIDVTDPHAPRPLGVTSGPWSAFDVDVESGVAVVAGRGGVTTLDISDPAAARPLGAAAAEVGGAVELHRGFAYVGYGESDEAGLHVYDVRDPTRLDLLASLPPDGDGWLGTASDIEIAGDTALVADEGSGLRVIDVSTPATPVEVGLARTRYEQMYLVAPFEHWAYGALRNGALAVFDVSHPATPRLVTTLAVSDDPREPPEITGLTVATSAAGPRLYVSVRTRPYDVEPGLLLEYDISLPTAPRPLRRTSTGGEAYDVAAQRDVLVVATDTSGLVVLGRSPPYAPLWGPGHVYIPALVR